MLHLPSVCTRLEKKLMTRFHDFTHMYHTPCSTLTLDILWYSSFGHSTLGPSVVRSVLQLQKKAVRLIVNGRPSRTTLVALILTKLHQILTVFSHCVLESLIYFKSNQNSLFIRGEVHAVAPCTAVEY